MANNTTAKVKQAPTDGFFICSCVPHCCCTNIVYSEGDTCDACRAGNHTPCGSFLAPVTVAATAATNTWTCGCGIVGNSPLVGAPPSYAGDYYCACTECNCPAKVAQQGWVCGNCMNGDHIGDSRIFMRCEPVVSAVVILVMPSRFGIHTCACRASGCCCIVRVSTEGEICSSCYNGVHTPCGLVTQRQSTTTPQADNDCPGGWKCSRCGNCNPYDAT